MMARFGEGLNQGCIRCYAGVHPKLRPSPPRLHVFFMVVWRERRGLSINTLAIDQWI